MKRLQIPFVLFLLGLSSPGYSQADADKKREGKKTETERVLRAYSSCRFEDGLRISEVSRLQRGELNYIARPTAKGLSERGTPAGTSPDRYFVRDDGTRLEGVTQTDSLRIMVDYNKPNYFANIRVDLSSDDGYREDKAILIRWINFLHSERPDSATQSPVGARYNGFETYSTYRRDVDVKKDELGISVLFDDKHNLTVTIYFLNQLPKHRIHNTTEEWDKLRERFLTRYSACVSENLNIKDSPRN